MQVVAKTDKGKVRSINQDAYAAKIMPDGTVFAAVCDGMGGASAGDIASRTAVDIISDYFSKSYMPTMSPDNISRLIANAIDSANFEVYSLSKKDARFAGMGTTAVVVVARENQAIICNIGDSRAYLIRDKLVQITRDHSIVQNLVESGRLSPEQARTHPEKNVITRALGVESHVLIDSYFVDIVKDDKILLCSDGLSNYVDSDNILSIVKNNAFDRTAELLINQANLGGGMDNITAVIVSRV